MHRSKEAERLVNQRLYLECLKQEEVIRQRDLAEKDLKQRWLTIQELTNKRHVILAIEPRDHVSLIVLDLKIDKLALEYAQIDIYA